MGEEDGRDEGLRWRKARTPRSPPPQECGRCPPRPPCPPRPRPRRRRRHRPRAPPPP
jgi:hypothetical protein